MGLGPACWITMPYDILRMLCDLEAFIQSFAGSVEVPPGNTTTLNLDGIAISPKWHGKFNGSADPKVLLGKS